MALKENDVHRVAFVKSRNEGGISCVWDPVSGKEVFNVFIHSRLPFCELESHEFAQFAEARSFAAKLFKDWEMFAWDLKTKRPCEEGGKECGSGECDTCKSIKAEGEITPFEEANGTGCGSCGGA